MDQPSRRRHALVGLASMVAGAVILVAAPVGNAGATAQQEPPTPSSSVVEGDNPDCGDLGDFAFEFKIDDIQELPDEGLYPPDGPDPATGFQVEISDVHVEGGTAFFSFESNIAVSAVFVKAGPGGILYTFEPPSTVGIDLASPKDSISHISFCWNAPPPTTTTTTTTTTTAPPSTSTTLGESTTTTAIAAVTTTTPSGELPRTGSTAGPMLGIGAALLVGGAALVGYARRFLAS
ncbi:MAG TPA: LPXTG cell wall anchor domain-containing protein [Acidimicrobiales bacterium]|nr:LPXTG cell wall anchor domain-containing protein [Acidimicrobiales bacterium]